jgi:hypothetical protein
MADRGMGYVPDPAGAEAFVSTLPHPTIASAGPDLTTDGKTDVFLYESLLRCMPGWKRGSQGSVGSCVGWGSALGVDLLAACDIHWRKEPEQWGGRCIEASLYAFSRVESRGLKVNAAGDGSTGFHAAKSVRDFGCLHYGQEYGSVMISSHSSERERDWGRNGVPDTLEPFAKQRVCSETTLVTSFAECARAVSNGYPLIFCSGQGFSMSRDDDGFCKPGGVWWHCMAGAGLRWGKRPGILICNSWGRSNTVGKHYPENIPEEVRVCSFWADADVIDRMCQGKDSYAYAGYSGFKRSTMPNWTGDVL